MFFNVHFIHSGCWGENPCTTAGNMAPPVAEKKRIENHHETANKPDDEDPHSAQNANEKKSSETTHFPRPLFRDKRGRFSKRKSRKLAKIMNLSKVKKTFTETPPPSAVI